MTTFTILRFLLFPVLAALLTFCSCTDEPVQPPPDEPPVHTQQDTTSHDVTWEVYRLGRPGAGGSLIRDIYALNDTDVWAVGRFVTNETDSVGNPTTEYYNAVHWDGKKWDFYRLNEEIYVRGHPREGTPKYVELYAVWVFGHNDLVAIDVIGRSQWWDGKAFKMDVNMARDGYITKMWARSKEDFYYCGYNGTFGRYFNGGYHKINSHTSIELNDVYGNNDEQVWTSGLDPWSYDRAFVVVDNGYVRSIGTKEHPGARTMYITEDTMYAYTGIGVLIRSIQDSSHFRYCDFTPVPDKWYGFIRSMRGTGDNNIFAAGYYNTILHYNGKSWKLVTDASLSSNILFWAVSATGNSIFAGGKDIVTEEAIVYIGKLEE